MVLPAKSLNRIFSTANPALAKLCLPLAVLAILLFLSTDAFPDNTQKKVLIFSSDDHNLPPIALMDKAIRSRLNDGVTERVQIFDEGLDSVRIPNEKYEAELVRLLQRKYEGQRFDLIFAIAPPSLRFLLKYQGELFSDSPIVFVGPELSRVADLDFGANVTAVGGKKEYAPTLELALKVHPETENVFVVAGSSPSDTAAMDSAQKEFREYESKAEFTYLRDLTVNELRDRLSVLPDRSIVMYLSFLGDNTGNSYRNTEVLSLLSSSSNAPFYSFSQALIGHGTVGGQLTDYEAIGNLAGENGQRILNGESPRDIPSQTVPNTWMFDWRQLQRWGIGAQDLPAESVVLFQVPTFWEQYKWPMFGMIALSVIEASLIIWLLYLRSRRKEAEIET
jgi:ABC-type uncharacterized transport system substrate-binding protein